ncbi:SGNH/GDSL hydrolase family protein [Limosilactobacillus reuteri]|uniref:SGNH/GDSL hydrolase family protein n=1 Tax=Limosilactobacillus reuteri TaxID=1598 RepID=UPI0036D37D67
MTRLIAFGDSIFAGWDGKENVSANQRIPELIGQHLGWQVTNVAIGGTKYDNSSNGFTAMVNKTDVAGFDYALVSYGVNNFSWPDPLVVVKQNALNGFKALKKKNPQLKILLELPTEDFRQGSKTLYDVNDAFWNQNQLNDMLIDVAKQEGLEYYDWRPDPLITYENANQTLGDGNAGVHPTKATMRAIAQRLAEKFKQMAGGTVQPDNPPPHVDPPKPDKPDDNKQPGRKPDKPKIVPKLSLARLGDDPFQLRDNVQDNIKRILAFLKILWNELPEFFRPKISFETTVPAPDKELSRPLRNYVINALLIDVEQKINELIGACNSHHIISMESFQLTGLLSLDPPRRLDLNGHYKDGLNYQYYLIENKLNELATYIYQ